MGDDGTIVPRCIDPQTGELKLDKDGFPVGMNFWAGMDGQVYVRGNIYATDGVFKGKVFASGGEFTGTIKAAILDGKLAAGNNGGLIEGVAISVGTPLRPNLFKVDTDTPDGKGKVTIQGNVDIGGDVNIGGNITWDSSSFPIQSLFAATNSAKESDWHPQMTAADKWRKDKGYNGQYGAPYQFRGTDGKNGSPGVVDYSRVNQILKETYGITETFITGEKIGSPVIQGAKIYGCEIYAGGNGEKGGQVIGLTDKGIQVFNGTGTNVLTIHEINGGSELQTDFSFLTLNSPYVNIGRDKNTITTFFYGSKVDFTNVQEVDFAGVNIKGLHVTLA